jgi:hypothetical protein
MLEDLFDARNEDIDVLYRHFTHFVLGVLVSFAVRFDVLVSVVMWATGEMKV